ncbi:MAG TPA: hypothetical protein VHP57_05865, partial [Acidimicrobiia bacterium]|nr:hypothetical protein [Acidimicrobiia bacterium]
AVPDNGGGGSTDPPNNGGGGDPAGNRESSSNAAATPAESTLSGTLPFTGAPVLQLMMLGVLLLGAGLGATAATRRRRRPIACAIGARPCPRRGRSTGSRAQ